MSIWTAIVRVSACSERLIATNWTAHQIVPTRMKELLTLVPCHRMPSRCLHIKGKPMPLCARCSAMLIGYLFLPLILILPVHSPFWLCFLLMCPLLIDGFTQRWKWRESTNALRFITGLLFGIGQSLFISASFHWFVGFLL
ncbi:DUF2085 domain-containing protein [Peribacillus sp. SCS-26]|uniref:DUF2085 domain-containing protein n=1 Tax=Paraperibacillus marinus TaxID=3115295 RepID=UPI0039066169